MRNGEPHCDLNPRSSGHSSGADDEPTFRPDSRVHDVHGGSGLIRCRRRCSSPVFSRPWPHQRDSSTRLAPGRDNILSRHRTVRHECCAASGAVYTTLAWSRHPRVPGRHDVGLTRRAERPPPRGSRTRRRTRTFRRASASDPFRLTSPRVGATFWASRSPRRGTPGGGACRPARSPPLAALPDESCR